MTKSKHFNPIAVWKISLLSCLLLFAFSCKDDGDMGEDNVCEAWDYEGTNGPDNWVSLCDDYMDCNGMLQSPVNIVNAQLNASLTALLLNYGETETSISYNGHTVEFEVDSATSILTLNGVAFRLQQFHFHTQSEHKINGTHSPMEAHLVHQDASGNRAVVSVMFEDGAENVFLSQFVDNLPNTIGTPYETTMTFNPEDMLPTNKSYFTYPGSLTTPPCSQNVTWFVLSTMQEASTAQISKFESILNGNFRPEQPLDGRTIGVFVE